MEWRGATARRLRAVRFLPHTFCTSQAPQCLQGPPVRRGPLGFKVVTAGWQATHPPLLCGDARLGRLLSCSPRRQAATGWSTAKGHQHPAADAYLNAIRHRHRWSRSPPKRCTIPCLLTRPISPLRHWGRPPMLPRLPRLVVDHHPLRLRTSPVPRLPSPSRPLVEPHLLGWSTPRVLRLSPFKKNPQLEQQ